MKLEVDITIRPPGAGQWDDALELGNVEIDVEVPPGAIEQAFRQAVVAEVVLTGQRVIRQTVQAAYEGVRHKIEERTQEIIRQVVEELDTTVSKDDLVAALMSEFTVPEIGAADDFRANLDREVL